MMAFSSARAQNVHDEVLTLEKNFATAVANDGPRAGFLAYSAPEGIVFERGTALNAPATWQRRPATNAGKLAWHPVWTDVAQSGELAYTTGPWTLTPNDDKTPTSAGQYVTVWQRQPSGEWKFVVDMGVEHAPIAEPAAGIERPSTVVAQPTPTPAPSNALLAVERKFDAAELREPAKTYEQNLSTEGRLYRPGQLALTGTTAQIVSENPGYAYLFVPTTVRLAASGDLGFVVGTLRRPSPANKNVEETGSYLRIWRREAVGGWRIAVEMLNLTPREDGAVASMPK